MKQTGSLDLITWNLDSVMNEAKITDQALAEFCGKDRNTIYRWRKKQPNLDGEKKGRLLLGLNLLKKAGHPFIELTDLETFSLNPDELKLYMDAQARKGG